MGGMGGSRISGLLARAFHVAGSVPGPLVTTLLRGTVNLLGGANTILATDGATAGGSWVVMDSQLHFGAVTVGLSVADRWMRDNMSHAAISTDLQRQIVTRAGTLSGFFVRQQTAGSADGGDNTYTVEVNGVSTAIVVVLANDSTALGSDVVNEVVVSAGDEIGVLIERENVATTTQGSVTASVGFRVAA